MILDWILDLQTMLLEQSRRFEQGLWMRRQFYISVSFLIVMLYCGYVGECPCLQEIDTEVLKANRASLPNGSEITHTHTHTHTLTLSLHIYITYHILMHIYILYSTYICYVLLITMLRVCVCVYVCVCTYIHELGWGRGGRESWNCSKCGKI